jgi:hypothetical protein
MNRLSRLTSVRRTSSAPPPSSLRGELNSAPSSLSRAVSEPKTKGRKRKTTERQLPDEEEEELADEEEGEPTIQKRQRRGSRRIVQRMSTLQDTDEEEVEGEQQEGEREEGRRGGSRRKGRR